MKHRLLGVAFVVVASFLGGCPIYSGAGQYTEYRVCNETGCYSCPHANLSPACVPWKCATDADCRNGYQCGYDPAGGGTCVAAGGATPAPPACASPTDCLAGYTCGQDGACHLGDCSGPGCPSGYQCTLTGGRAQCIAMSAGSLSGSTDAAPAEAGAPPGEGGSGDALVGVSFDSSDGLSSRDGTDASGSGVDGSD